MFIFSLIKHNVYCQREMEDNENNRSEYITTSTFKMSLKTLAEK